MLRSVEKCINIVHLSDAMYGWMKQGITIGAAYMLLACGEPAQQVVHSPLLSPASDIADGVRYTVTTPPARTAGNMLELSLRRVDSTRPAVALSVSYCAGSPAGEQKSLDELLRLGVGAEVQLRDSVAHGSNICSSRFL